jgi:hypothetical protein
MTPDEPLLNQQQRRRLRLLRASVHALLETLDTNIRQETKDQLKYAGFWFHGESGTGGLLRNPTLEPGRSLTRKRPSATAAVASLAQAAFCPFGQQEADGRFFNTPTGTIFRGASDILEDPARRFDMPAREHYNPAMEFGRGRFV